MQQTDTPIDKALMQVASRLSWLLDESAKRSEDLAANFRELGITVRPPESDCDWCEVSQFGISELSQQLGVAVVDFAKILFKSWFVDFTPVIAKAEGETLNLSIYISDLFPGEMEDSALGEIPKGWHVGTFSEVLNPVSTRIGNENAPEFSATVRGLELRGLRFNKLLARAQSKNKRIEKDDLVFGLSRRVLNFGLMTSGLGSVSPVYEVFRINAERYVPELLELYIRFHMQLHLDILKPGAREGQPIDRNYLLSKEVLIPDIRVQRVFRDILKGQKFRNV
jgi:type I restriction enzyme S subunit